MLSFFRRALSSWVTLGLLGLVMLAFIITGVTPGPTGSGGGDGSWVARVGGEPVTVAEVSRNAERALEAERAQRPGITMPEFLRAGALEEIIRQMVTGEALESFGEEQGLVASKRMVDGEIASLPAFRGLNGRFDENIYRQALASQNVSEQELRDSIAGSIVQRMLLQPAGAGTRAPVGVARQYAALLLETREGFIGVVPTRAVAAGPAPTAAELQAYYGRDRARYTTPERRVIRYALIDPARVPAPPQPIEAEIQAAYNNNPAYRPSETRTLAQAVFPTQAAANAAAAAARGGRSLAEAANSQGSELVPVEGAQTREVFARFASPEVAATAFAAPQGGIAGPARSPFGFHLVQVTGVQRTGGRPLAAVRGEIVDALLAERRRTALSDYVRGVEDLVGEGATFDEVVRARNLPVQQTPAVTEAGVAPDQPSFRAPPGLAPVLRAGFQLGADDDPAVETVAADSAYALIDVAQVIEAAPPPLQAIRAQVVADFTTERAARQAGRIAQQIAERASRGLALPQAFAQAGVALPRPQPVSGRRADLARLGDQVPPPLLLLFNVAQGRARAQAAPDGAGWFVVQASRITPGNVQSSPGVVEATRAQFARIAGDELAEQFARAAEGAVGVERDAGAVARLKEELSGGQQPGR